MVARLYSTCVITLSRSAYVSGGRLGRVAMTVTLAVVTATSALFAAPLPADAASACVGSGTNLFAGRFGYTATTYGSKASLGTVDPGLCSGANTASTAWSMLAPQATNAWAQSGFVKETAMSPTIIYYFAQWRRNGASTPNTLYTSPGPSAGTVHIYQTLVNSNGYVEMYRDTTLMARSTWKPADNWGAQPWSNQYSGETWHCQTDVPGYEWNKEHFTSVLYQAQVGGNWLTPVGLGTYHDCGSAYQVLTVSSTAFDVWTYRP